MRKVAAISLFVALTSSAYMLKGQHVVTLSGLLKSMEQWNQLYRVVAATDSVFGIRKANIGKSYYPKIDLNAEATWQSDVTHVSIPFPGVSIPEPDRDSYRITIDLSQLVWDGGVTKAQLQLEEENRKIEKNRVNSELYGQKERVVSLFFSILSIDLANEQLRLMANELEKRLGELEASVKAGAALESSLNALKAEKLRLMQSIEANISQRYSLISAIQSLTGQKIDDGSAFLLPVLTIPNQYTCLRPDYIFFELQNSYLLTASETLASKRMPRLSAFARVGYGKPGLNMLSNKFDSFAMVGARFSWNIWDWNSTSRERQVLKIQQNIFQYRRIAFNEGFNAQVSSAWAQIQSLQRQIQNDEQIVELLDKSVRASASQLSNGTITSSVYLSDFNSLLRAKVDMELRRVKLAYEVAKLYITLGLSINE